MSYSFREINSLEKRKLEFDRIKKKYPDRVPVIVEKFTGDKYLPFFLKNKYIVPENTTVGQLLYMVRNKLPIGANMALFFFIENMLPPTNIRIGELYDRHRDDDGFLYAVVTSEATFGTLIEQDDCFFPDENSRVSLVADQGLALALDPGLLQ